MSDKIFNRNFVCMFLAYLCFVISYMILIPTFPMYVQNLGYMQDIVGFLTGIFTVTAVLSRPVVGRKLDTGDRKLVFLTGAVIAFVCISSYYFLENVYSLMIVRLVHGIGIGITTSAANTIAADFIPKHKMAEGVGYFSFGTVFGMAAAPALGLYLVEYAGFAGVFLWSSAIALVGFVLGFLIRYSPEQKAALRQMAAANAAQKMTWSNMFEQRALRPALTVLLAGATYNGMSAFMALYAEAKGVGNIGLYFTFYALALVFSRIFSGKIADRKGYPFVIIPSLLIAAVAVSLLYFADTLAVFLVVAVLFALGFGSAQTALQAMSVTSVPPNRRGAAVSTHFTGLDLSILVGTSLGGLMAKQFGYETMMPLLVIPMLLSLIVFLTLGKWFRPRPLDSETDRA